MWNIYVVAIMIFYAPSHKNKPDTHATNGRGGIFANRLVIFNIFCFHF